MLSVEEKNIYEKLYGIVDRNVQNAGEIFVPSKVTFLLAAELEPQRTNLALLKDVCKEEVVQAAYMAILRRLPDEAAIQYWNQPDMLEKKDYNKLVIQSLVNSAERTIKGIDLYNADIIGIKMSKFGELTKSLAPCFNLLYKVYRLLPESFRLVIRKILR